VLPFSDYETIIMMRRILSSALLTAITAWCLPAYAGGLTRTFVSSTGSDSNPCTTAAPCATFAAAYAAVAPNGIVAALNPGKYGPLTITGAVSIDGNGWAAITAPNSGAAITVNAQSGTVHLRGLNIDGAGTGQTGISYSSGSALIIENCVIRDLLGDGIDGAPLGGSLSVSDTMVTNTAGSGIVVGQSGSSGANGAITALFNRVRTEYNNTYGIEIGDDGSGTTTLATVIDSTATYSGSGYAGFCACSNGGTTTVMIFHSVSTNNYLGIEQGSARAFIGQSVVTGNQHGGFGATDFQGSDDGTFSYGTNQISPDQGSLPSTGTK
jgi:hypothetical protein